MAVDDLLNFAPTFLLVFARAAGLMLSLPLLGVVRVPVLLKILVALVLAMGVSRGMGPATLPLTTWGLAAALASQAVFGLVMGLSLSITFTAFAWGGQMIGQQMGIGLGQMMDGESGPGDSPVSQLYLLMAVAMFLLANGHHAVLRGLRESFGPLPLTTAAGGRSLLQMLVGMLQASCGLALKLAAPMLLTMLIADLTVGFVGKTVPQLGAAAAAMSLRTALGLAVMILGLAMTSRTIRASLTDSVQNMTAAWARTASHG